MKTRRGFLRALLGMPAASQQSGTDIATSTGQCPDWPSEDLGFVATAIPAPRPAPPSADFGYIKNMRLMRCVKCGSLWGKLVVLLMALTLPAFAQVQHREDDPHVSGQYGTAFWCVRQDTATALAANGDYVPCILNSSGQLWTAAVQSGTWTVTANAGSGTFAIQATAAAPASVRLSDGAAFYDAAKTGQLPSALISGRLDVNIGAFGAGLQPLTDTQLRASPVPVDQATAAEADYDTGAGTVNQTMLGLALPAAGGPVAGGTSSNPLRMDPTGTTTQPISGTITANAGTGTFTVAGAKSHNTGTPGATNLGVLPAVAQAAAPSYTEGNQVGLSTDLSGALRVSGASGGGVAQTQVRNEADAAWVNVGVGAESGTVLHVPIQIQDADTEPAAVVNTAQASEFGLVTRPIQPTRTATDTLSAAGNCSSVLLDGAQSAGLEVSGTHTGLDLRVEVSTDNGTTFRGVDAYDIATETTRISLVANGSYAWFILPGGTSHVRCRVAAITTGSVTAATRVTYHAPKQHVAHDRVPGSSDPGHVLALGASDGTNLQRLRAATSAPAGTEQGLIVRNVPSGTQTISGTVTANAGTGTFTVGDGGGSLTVDAPVGTPIAVRPSDGAVAQTYHELDLDTGAGTQTRISVGVAGAAAGGSVPIEGTTANGLEVDVTRVQGSVAADTTSADQITALGSKSSNGGAPGATNLGTLPAVATAAAPTYTEGNQVSLSANLAGATRVILPGTSTVAISQTTTDNDVDVLTLPANASINQAQRGGTAVVAGRCEREEPIPGNINQTANAQLITGVAGERIYICSYHVVSTTAQSVAFVEGTGTTCGTGTTALDGFGGPTAATGWPFAANGGIAVAATTQSYGRTDTNANNVCLFQSGTGQVSGGFTYVSIAP